jgi:NIPSNAP
LEIRLFTLRPGTRAEFDRTSREGTIPLIRRCGITVLTFGPCLNDDDGYVLMRLFPSEQERVELAEAFYASTEWKDRYEARVMPMIADYRTAVVPATADALSPRARRRQPPWGDESGQRVTTSVRQ